MKKSISKTFTTKLRNKVNNDPMVKLSRNACTQLKIPEVAMNWDSVSRINHTYSHLVEGEMKVTNQKKSGRCWGFAGLNLLRIGLGKKYKIKQFEFSQNYFMFWDKLEKSNYFLENILSTLNEPLEGRLVMHLLTNPVEDGGQWDMFVNLIEKYGVVPKSVMPESYQSSNSYVMNKRLTNKLREFAHKLRTDFKSGKTIKNLRDQKEAMMETIYKMVTISLGTPPESFDWEIRDKKKEFHRHTEISPIDFYHKYVSVKLKDKICLINAPMDDKPYNKLFTVKCLGNVIDGQIVKYINLESEQLKRYAIKSIQNDEPVWFGSEVVGVHNDLGIFDNELYDYNLVFGTDFTMDKSTRLHYGESMMTHAMLFTAVDIKNRKPMKWRVENSWADKHGDSGYYMMTDKWFDEHLFEIVIDKKYLPKSIVEIYDTKPIELEPWDPMGSLAS